MDDYYDEFNLMGNKVPQNISQVNTESQMSDVSQTTVGAGTCEG